MPTTLICYKRDLPGTRFKLPAGPWQHQSGAHQGGFLSARTRKDSGGADREPVARCRQRRQRFPARSTIPTDRFQLLPDALLVPVAWDSEVNVKARCWACPAADYEQPAHAVGVVDTTGT